MTQDSKQITKHELALKGGVMVIAHLNNRHYYLAKEVVRDNQEDRPVHDRDRTVFWSLDTQVSEDIGNIIGSTPIMD